MARANLADEVKWLRYRDRSHARVLLCILAKTRIDTADRRFVPFYVLSAAGRHAVKYVSACGVDFDGLTRASANMGPEANAMIRLRAALWDPPHPADIAETLSSLANTPSFEVAINALCLRWEL